MKRLYHFTTAQYAFDDIRNERLKVAQFSDLNDPFELLCVDVLKTGHEQAFNDYKAEMALRFGVLCFTAEWNGILQWSHYADRHRGICLGFDVSSFETKFGPVEYKSRKLAFPNTLDQAFAWRILRTKYRGWHYEQEWRAFITLEESERNVPAERDLYFAKFGGELTLREVILGVENKNTTREVHDALHGYPDPVQVSQIRLSPSEFRLQKHIF